MRTIDADALKEIFDITFFNDEDDYKRALRIIDNAPTVINGKDYDLYIEGYKQGKKGLDRPRGEWIICNQDNEGIHKIECPFCKYVNGSDFGGLITLTFDRLPPFCEKCGADMRGNNNEQ